jgi:glycosyltransferase involved in cell wall biosynthesis
MVQDINNRITFIIPTYNRKDLVGLAIDSALSFISNDYEKYDIIVIDDCSTDNTYEYLIQKYQNEIRNFTLKIITMPANSGVVAARNEGVKKTNSEWLVFLDSDNQILKKNKKEFESILKKSTAKCVCFRCVNDAYELIGPKHLSDSLTLENMLNDPVVELFGVYRKKSYEENFFRQDIVDLRCFEVIAMCNLVLKSGPFEVSNKPIRKYSFEGSDRLSSRSGVLKNSLIMTRGNIILLKEFRNWMTLKTILKTILKIICYSIVSIYFKFFS